MIVTKDWSILPAHEWIRSGNIMRSTETIWTKLTFQCVFFFALIWIQIVLLCTQCLPPFSLYYFHGWNHFKNVKQLLLLWIWIWIELLSNHSANGKYIFFRMEGVCSHLPDFGYHLALIKMYSKTISVFAPC